MNFLALIIALALHQVIKPGNPLQRDDWLLAYDRFLSTYLQGAGLRLVVLLVSLGFAAAWILDALGAWFFGLPELLAGAVVLVWSLGREDYHTALERFEARYAREPDVACESADMLWSPRGDPETNPPNPDACALALERITYSGYARWFAPVFFFVLLGPVGALLYRATAILARHRSESAQIHLLYYLDWLPARLLALTFALTGDFLAVMHEHPFNRAASRRSAGALLWETAASACGGVEGARHIGAILYRSAGLWLLLISLGFMLR